MLLYDTFNRKHDYLRISVTDSCNLRCLYCVPSGKINACPSGKLMTRKEIRTLAEVFTDLGVKKIRLTGGEPLVRKDIAEILLSLSELPVELAITTNGTRVDQFIEVFKEAGIRSVNVSLDTMNPERFSSITAENLFDKVLANILLLVKNNFHVKVNSVVMQGVNDDEILALVNLTKDLPIHLRFIEFMPFSGNEWGEDKMVAYYQILQTIGRKHPFVKLADEAHETAKKYRVKGYEGTFAVISSMTDPFCGDCNRLRLTADGKMKNCLFSKGEYDLLTPLRKGEDILPIIAACVRSKEAVRGGQHDLNHMENRSMVAIGG